MEASYSLSIGVLSKATGVPIDTLRTWERRYGFPRAERTESGHRRYPASIVRRLQLALRAMEAGHRPASVLRASEAELEAMLPDALLPDVLASEEDCSARGAAVALAPVTPLLDHVKRFEGRALERELRRSWAELGGMAFIAHCAAPFLTALGDAWERGDLTVAHEHFASERLRDFLVQQWRPLSDTATGPYVVCAVPSGDSHALGLHLVAATLALHGIRVVFLGADMPSDDVARTAVEHGAAAVVMSVSISPEARWVRQQLHHLRTLLPPDTRLLCGGAGAPKGLPGCEQVNSFFSLARAAVTLGLRPE